VTTYLEPKGYVGFHDIRNNPCELGG